MKTVLKPLAFAFALMAIGFLPTEYVQAQSQTAKANAPAMVRAQAQSRAYLNNKNIPASGVALDGYCPVAYFAVNKPVKGDAKYAVEYKDVIYYLVNADAKAAFQKNPEKFIPAYGGWCAFGMAIGDKFPIDPTNFKIVNGRLHVFLRNRNVDAMQLWNKGIEADYEKKASAHWMNVNK